MVNRNKRSVVWSLFVVLLLVASACSGNGEGKSKPSATGSAPGSATAPAETSASAAPLEGRQISADPIDLTIFLHMYEGAVVFKDDWPVFKRASELTNIRLEGVASSASTDDEAAFATMMASNDLADIIHSHKPNFNEYGPQGALIPLNGLIEAHAPNFKKVLEERPDVRQFITAADGNIYFIPYLPSGKTAMGYFIRQDWLDALELPLPKTKDEYYETLKAFKEKDPNNNGKADEIPYFNRQWFGLFELLPMWDARRWMYLKEGEIRNGNVEPAYKTAIAEIAKWYQEGLIDKEIFTRGSNARQELIGANVGGATNDWFSSTAGLNETQKEKVPGLKFLPFAPPASATGRIVEQSARDQVNPGGWGISSQNKHPEATMEYLDFWWTEEGSRLANFGVEGLTYDLVDGKPKLKEELLASENFAEEIRSYGVSFEYGYRQDLEFELQWENPIAAEGKRLYEENDYIETPVPVLSYTEEEEKRMLELQLPLETYMDETVQSWVLGAESVEAGWDKYIAQTKALGLDEYMKIVNDAYKRSLGS